LAAKDRLVALGVITGAHGIKGEVVLRSYTAEPAAIARYGPLQTAGGESVEIVRLRPKNDTFIATLRGIADRTRAETLKGSELFVLRSRLPDPEDNEVYLEDLIGLTAVSPAGAVLGKIVRILNFGAGDLLELAVEGRKDTVLVPADRCFVTEFDLAQARVVLDTAEGFCKSPFLNSLTLSATISRLRSPWRASLSALRTSGRAKALASV
jgi:16S rRNA processing protein RimM